MKIADILIFRGVPRTFSYSFDHELPITIGRHVTVPFGKRNVSGLVIDIKPWSGPPLAQIKSVINILEKKPQLPNDLVQLILWFSNYYGCTPYKAYQCIVGKRQYRNSPTNTKKASNPSPFTLSNEQENVVNQLLSDDSPGKREALLHGVTSSGKTEIYLRIAEHVTKQHKSIIILVPEIALTPQFNRHFTERFGTQVAILHSHQRPKERDIEWSQILDDEKQIIIGPRSAIFSPVRSLGAIIIDEEHEGTYKQETHPRYYTHAIAQKRAGDHHALLLYGSATPSITTCYRCQSHSFPILKMTQRIHNRPLPSIQLIDQRDPQNQLSIITPPLEQAISHALSQNEQVIILLNRRGFAPHVSCSHCHHIFTCPDCQLSFTYHNDRQFRCHRCNTCHPITHTCPSCKRKTLQFGGLGIQKAEYDIKKLFPTARLYRLDRDSATTFNDIEATLSAFRENGDILIGTQLIAKGHHIEKVTLVGVIGIDTTLNMPDYRSPERAFQLITQVAGRAGRGDKKGHVFIQTSQPTHYAIRHAATHNFDAFYAEEIPYRESLGYPPFKDIINIIISSPNQNETKTTATEIFKSVSDDIRQLDDTSGIQLLYPKPAPIEKIRRHYRWNILLKYPPEHAAYLKSRCGAYNRPQGHTRVIVDIDPLSLL